MPVIRPFRGFRYNPEVIDDIKQVVAPPYDIIYDEWRERLYERNPYNIVRLIKTKDDPGDSVENNKYSRAREYEQSWIRDGILKLEKKPAFYVRSDSYKINGKMKTRYGFIALTKVEDFGNSIHPHERTLSAPKTDRLNLLKATNTNLSQIFSIFNDPDNEIHTILVKITHNEPDVQFTDEQGIIRKMWVVYDNDSIAHIQNLMKERDIIIADGHHRYETSLAYKDFMDNTRENDDEPFDYVSMYFSSANDDGMTILPTHRKVGRLNGFNDQAFSKDLSDEFEITCHINSSLDDILRLIKKDSDRTNIFGVYTKKGLVVAKLKNPPVPKDLDVDVLHDVIIEKKLGISKEDIAQGKYIHFCKSPEHAFDDVAEGKDQVSFFMNALTSEELFREVLKGRRMPQKSTYFFPKTLSGLVMYKISRESLENYS